MPPANGEPPPPGAQLMTVSEPLTFDERELLAKYRELRERERQSKLVIEFDRDGNWRMYKYVPVAKCC